MVFECAQYRLILTAIRLTASLLADGIKTERGTPTNCNVNSHKMSLTILSLPSIVYNNLNRNKIKKTKYQY